MSGAPHGLRLCGVHLSEAVGIFVEHYGVTREDGKRSIVFGVVNSVVHKGGWKPDLILVGRDMAAPAGSKPMPFDHDWLRQAELLYHFADDLLADEAGQPRIIEVRIWDRHSWDAYHRKGRTSFEAEDDMLIKNAAERVRADQSASLRRAVRDMVAGGARLAGDGTEESRFKRIERHPAYKKARAKLLM